MGMSVLLLGLAATAATAAAAAAAAAVAPTPPPSAADGVAATRGLLERLLGAECAGRFEPSLLHPSACSGETKLCFGYGAGSTAGTVALRGTSGVELAMAANHYLKYVANVSVSWENTGGVQAFMAPGPLPAPAAPVHVERSTTYHYYANVCTFSYSFVWYTLEDWVREIDCECALTGWTTYTERRPSHAARWRRGRTARARTGRRWQYLPLTHPPPLWLAHAQGWRSTV
jgi:hypothetical protein